MRRLFYILLVGLFFSEATSEAIPHFIPPVKGLMQLTGTFGELRGNHFHAGLDIRGPVGRPLYAIADGYVSRVKVSVNSYGQALYLNHPSGYTSVYGHMNRFRDDIADFVKDKQYSRESFLFDEDLPVDLFPVEQGDLIGYIGQRGFVSGPHLHFEIRDTKTERLLNPMNFGITVPDSRRPFINKMRLYELDKRGNVIKGTDYSVSNKGSGRYTTRQDTLYIDSPYCAFGVKAYDQQDGRPNYNGIYSLGMWTNDSLNYAYQMDHFAIEQTRYLNAHLDYEQQELHNSWFQRSYCMPGNQLDFYQTDSLKGKIHLPIGAVGTIRFKVADHRQNKAELSLVVKRRGRDTLIHDDSYTYYLPFDEASIIETGDLKAHFPDSSLYEDVYLDYEAVTEHTNGLYSAVHSLHYYTVPLHRYFDLHIAPHEGGVADSLKDKAVIVHCEDGGTWTSYGGEWTADNRLRAPVRTFGNFAIITDTVPPTITKERFAYDMRSYSQFSFKLDDNLPTDGKAKPLRFRAEVDGQWILMEYNGRLKRLYHIFDDNILSGEHELVLRVMDDRDNETIFKAKFKR